MLFLLMNARMCQLEKPGKLSSVPGGRQKPDSRQHRDGLRN
jgi:hypothetical protein